MPALPAAVVNTNGAGDCLVAGCCMRLLQGGTPLAALAFGLVCIFMALNADKCSYVEIFKFIQRRLQCGSYTLTVT